MTEIVAAHLERVEKLEIALTESIRVADGYGELGPEAYGLLAAALAACAREARLDEAKWWAQLSLCSADKIREADERLRALERAVGEKGKD